MKRNINKKEMFSVKEVAWLLVITCIANLTLFFLITSQVTFGGEKKPVYNDAAQKIIEAYDYIKDNYYEEIDDSILINGAISGMTKSLGDDYSMMIDESDSDTYNIFLRGEYIGIGVQIGNLSNGQIVITSIIKNSPAANVDLQAGDIIQNVNNMNTENMDSSDVSNYIKNGTEESFQITIVRGEETKTIEVKRGKIILESVTSEIIQKSDKKIGYIYINLFAINTASQFKEHLTKLETEGIDSLVIDVRNNSGGHLSSATTIMNSLLEKDKIMYQTDVRGKIEKVYSTGKTKKNYSIVLLGNGESASASEILIAALVENGIATFIGETTFGKGTVQELIDIDATGESYKITTKKWLTPNGNWINGNGIKPNITVQLPDTYYQDPKTENDSQLNKALEILTEGKIE